MTPVAIHIRTVYQSGGATEASDQKYAGKRFEKDGNTVLRYEEILCEGEPPVMTTLFVSERDVRLHRKGSVGGDMVFCAGEVCEFFYRTGFGNLAMQIKTESVDIQKNDSDIQIRLVYTLYTDGAEVSRNEMIIVCR